MSILVQMTYELKGLGKLRNEKSHHAIMTFKYFLATQRMASSKHQDLDVCLLRLSKLKGLRCLQIKGGETKKALTDQQTTRSRLMTRWFSRLRHGSLRAKTTQCSLLCLVQSLQRSISSNRIKFFEGRVKQTLVSLHNDVATNLK